MKPLFIHAAFSFLLTACVQSASPPTTVPAPPQPTGNPSSASLTPGNMPAYCRGEASGQYGVRPTYIKTGAIKSEANGFSIDGVADKGTEGKKPFRCRFNSKREFIDVMSLVNEGKL